MAPLRHYVPTKLPQDAEEHVSHLARWITDELTKLSRFFGGMSFVQLEVLHVAPLRPRNGMIVFADGSDWNPGSGAGMYAYVGGAWTKL